MRNFILGVVLILATMIVTTTQVRGGHVAFGEPVLNNLLCKTPQEAVVAMKLLIAGKYEIYRNYIQNDGTSCVDSTAFGVEGFVVVPQKKLSKYVLTTETGVLVLWKVLLGEDTIMYAWEGDTATET